MLNNSGDSGHPCLFPDLRGNAFSFSPLRIMFAVGLEKEMVTHSSILAWRIPGTDEPGGLPSMGSQSWTPLKWLSSRSKERAKQKCFFLALRYLEHGMERIESWIWLNIRRIDSFPGSSVSKESVSNGEYPGLILGLGRYSGEGNGNPLQYSCLENSMDRGAWWAIVQGVPKSQKWQRD